MSSQFVSVLSVLPSLNPYFLNYFCNSETPESDELPKRLRIPKYKSITQILKEEIEFWEAQIWHIKYSIELIKRWRQQEINAQLEELRQIRATLEILREMLREEMNSVQK